MNILYKMDDIELLNELDKLESFDPIIPTNIDFVNSYKNSLNYISNKLLSGDINSLNKDNLILNYYNNYNIFSDSLFISDFYNIYNSCKEIFHEIESPIYDYTDESFEYNGFIKSEFVIHEHDSKKAPLHWDLRWKTEFKTSAYSFVLLKHRLPSDENEKLLVKQQPMHPTQWVDMVETVIGHGYGQGSVKTVDRGIIYYKRKDKSFSFYLKGNIYKDAYHLININNSLFLIFKAKDSILADYDERNEEWITYAKNFIDYINKTFKQRYNLKLDLINNSNIKIAPDNEFYYYIKEYDVNNILYIPSINFILDIKKNNLYNMISKECKINNIEDIMRLLILRNYIAPKFFEYVKNNIYEDILNKVYDDIRDIDYIDDELELLKNNNYAEYMNQKVYRMFSDIYLGHKYYSQFDFERYLMNLLNKINLNKGE